MVEIKIQEATIKNLKDLQNLNHELCKKENKEFDLTIRVDWSFTKEGEKYFKEKITKDDECAFVVVINKKTIGYLVGELTEIEDYRNTSQIAELEDVFVLENYRNLGIGTRLYQEFINWCKSKGIKRVKVIVSTQNTKAINFYKKNHMEDYYVILEGEI